MIPVTVKARSARRLAVPGGWGWTAPAGLSISISTQVLQPWQELGTSIRAMARAQHKS